MRFCSNCKKPVETKDNYCRLCRRDINSRRDLLNMNLRKRYGITLKEYETLSELQEGKCKICGLECKANERLSVDHNHKTREVRGLLCHNCNNGLGCFQDSEELLIKALTYLMNNRLKS